MTSRSFDGGILIANRGEIALRVMRTARRLGYPTIAVYSDADAGAPHVAAADAALRIGPAAAELSYLDADAVIAAAHRSGAEAIHPGYGFLAERPDFVERCEREGLVFIGPSAAAMRALGDKAQAKRLLEGRGVPFVPGYHGADQADDAFVAAAARIGYPVMVKAAAGGGGRGMRLVSAPDALPAALASARAEAAAAFGDGTLLLERALVAPRHVEVQIAADAFGNVVHLGERDCSLQRRYQKLVEEAPSPAIGDVLRARLGKAAVEVARASGYEGVGTIEFLIDADGSFFFIEANARLQVEHTVTEAVAGIDLVEWQIRIARGETLPLAQDEVRLRGHAIEARLCAEDPARGFLPQTGTLVRWEPPAEVRVEHALAPGIAITPAYDSMIAKLIAHGPTRDDARRSLIRALETTVVLGVATNAGYLIASLRDPVFVAGETTTAFVAERAGRDDSVDDGVEGGVALAAVLRCDALARRSGFGAWTAWSASPRPPGIVTLAREPGGEPIAVRIDALDARTFAATIGDARYVVALPAGAPDAGLPSIVVDGEIRVVAYADDGDRLYLTSGGRAESFRDLAAMPATARPLAGGDGSLRAPTSGRVLAVSISVGDRVVRGAVAVVLEAMKMEHRIVFPHSGTIRTIAVNAGDQVALGDTLVAYDPV